MNDSRLIEKRPWISIWFRPRDTFRWVVERDSDRSVPLLCALYGISFELMTVFYQAREVLIPFTPAVTIGIALIGPALGFAVVNAAAGVIFWIGRLLNGRVSFRAIRAVVAWAGVPMIAAAPVHFCLWPLSSAYYNLVMNTGLLAAYLFLGFCHLALFIWSQVLVYKGIAETQGFSARRALLNYLLAQVILVAPISLLMSVIRPYALLELGWIY